MGGCSSSMKVVPLQSRVMPTLNKKHRKAKENSFLCPEKESTITVRKIEISTMTATSIDLPKLLPLSSANFYINSTLYILGGETKIYCSCLYAIRLSDTLTQLSPMKHERS